ncbi:dihydrolipoamide acetyltransferase family protein [Brachybacterium vulturis]|uniref:dihydrolipoamide acetyltransferase family protein n=1 Tax=Brachybacterium vulturis TaxID=2017484 RepID=UPI0037362297
MSDFMLPDLGEGLTEATIVTWNIAVGDEVTRNQAIAEVETAKALVELPSPRAGRITALYATEGETLAVGAPLIGLEEAGAAPAGSPAPAESAASPASAESPAPAESAASPASAEPPAPAESAASPASAEPPAPAESAASPASAESPAPAESAASPASAEAAGFSGAPQRQQVLVGYGPMLPGTGRPRRRPRSFETVPYVGRSAQEAAHPTPRAMPPVRRHARDLGVDLTEVHGTGPGGRILRTDVDACAQGGTSAPGGAAAQDGAGSSRGPASTRRPVTGLRRETARAMADSAFTAPHASVHTTLDVTDTLERLRRPDRDGRRTSFLAAVCRAIVPAAARTPAANARFDAEAGEIELFEQVSLGVAVATERGLVVATVPDADSLEGASLTEQIAEQAGKAREGSLTPAELTGSTLTVTNVGVFGVEGGVPILNPGQSIILAIGALRTQPWEHHGEVALRTVVTLTVSFDHRVLDGAEASRFLMDVADVLSDPAILLTR